MFVSISLWYNFFFEILRSHKLFARIQMHKLRGRWWAQVSRADPEEIVKKGLSPMQED